MWSEVCPFPSLDTGTTYIRTSLIRSSKLQTPLSAEWPLEIISRLNSKSGCGYRHGIEVHIVFSYTSELRTILSYRHPQEQDCQD